MTPSEQRVSPVIEAADALLEALERVEITAQVGDMEDLDRARHDLAAEIAPYTLMSQSDIALRATPVTARSQRASGLRRRQRRQTHSSAAVEAGNPQEGERAMTLSGIRDSTIEELRRSSLAAAQRMLEKSVGAIDAENALHYARASLAFTQAVRTIDAKPGRHQ